MAESTRLVSFLIEGDDVISCEVCLEDFHHLHRPPKILPCGHNFCARCLFSLCCHQEYYLLDSISCPTCRSPFSKQIAYGAPTNYDLCKILENVHKGREMNVTVISINDHTVIERIKENKEKNKMNTMCKGLAEKTTDAKHHRCMNCCRKLSFKSLSKISRYCQTCGPTTSVSFCCLECCVDHHNGHYIMTISHLEANQLKVLSELRSLRHKLLDASDSFDERLAQIRQNGQSLDATLYSSKQNLLTNVLSSLDESIRKTEVFSFSITPTQLSTILKEQIQNYSKMTKMNNVLEKSYMKEKNELTPTGKMRGLSSSSALRQSRLTLRSDDSFARSSLLSVISLFPDDIHSHILSQLLHSISSKDTVVERKNTFLDCARQLTLLIYRDIEICNMGTLADAFLNIFYQLNVLSRKQCKEKNECNRTDIWKQIQFAYNEMFKIAAKHLPSFHPERVDLIDDLAYLCHLYSDVCDQGTVTICMIEAARARASEGSLEEEDRLITQHRLQLIDDHLVECRRKQKLLELRTIKNEKKDKLKRFWKSCIGMNKSFN